MKQIEAINDDGQVIHRFRSIRDAVRAGIATSYKGVRGALKGRAKSHAKLRWREAGSTAKPLQAIRPTIDGTHRVFQYIKLTCDTRGAMKWNDFAGAFVRWVKANFEAESVNTDRLLDLVQSRYTVYRPHLEAPRLISGLQWKVGVHFEK